jgi:hypothetical protein
MSKPPPKHKSKLNPQQELFCFLYSSDREFLGNGVDSYAEAYNVDKKNKNWYKTACQSASRLLSNVNICARINELLTADGLNDQNVDKQLLFLINQHDDKNAKIQALREYNKLKARITEKHDLTSDGKPILIQHIYSKNVTSK